MHHRDRKIMLSLYLIFLVLSCISISQLSVPLVIDEAGTLAITAGLSGDDWSYCVHAMGDYYYKPGLSILYIPVYLAFRSDPVLMYRMLLLYGMMFVCTIPVTAYWILRKYLHAPCSAKTALASGCATGIPSIWLYAMYTRAEVMLIWLPWPILLVLLRLTDNLQNKERQFYTILLSFLCVYAYFVHSRGVVFLAGSLLTLLFLCIRYKSRLVHRMAFCISLPCFLITEKMLSQVIKHKIYLYGMGGASVESFQFRYLKLLPTKQGLVTLIRLLIGWLFNFIVSTYGLVLLGMIGAFLVLWRVLRNKNTSKADPLVTICLFIVLCTFGVFAMGMLFFFPQAYKLLHENVGARADRMLYGRYIVCMSGMLSMLAVYFLFIRKDRFLRIRSLITATVLFICICALFLGRFAHTYEELPMNTRYFLSLTAFFEFPTGSTSDYFPGFTKYLMLIACCSFMIFIFFIMCNAGHTQYWKRMVLVLIIASLGLYARVFWNSRIRYNHTVEKDVGYPTQFIRSIDRDGLISSRYPLVYLGKTASFRQHFQPMLPAFDVGNQFSIKNAQSKDMIIFTRSPEETVLNVNRFMGEDNYYSFDSYDDNASANTILVRGENLKDLLERSNISLHPFNGITESNR